LNKSWITPLVTVNRKNCGKKNVVLYFRYLKPSLTSVIYHPIRPRDDDDVDKRLGRDVEALGILFKELLGKILI